MELMELHDLLEQEGLDADSAEQTLEWARARAAELVQGMGQDPELGPLLDAGLEPTGSSPEPAHALPAEHPLQADDSAAARALPSPEHDTTAPVLTEADASIPQHVVDPPSYGLTAAQAELAAAEAELAAAQAELQAVDPQTATAEPAPLDPLAGIDFESMPDEDEAHGEPVANLEAMAQAAALGADRGYEPESTIPSMHAPLGHDVTLTTMASPHGEPSEVTLRAHNPLAGEHDAEAEDAGPSEPAADAEPDEDIEELEEIELLDDDMIELVDEDEDEDEVPEWKAALTSAQLGGGQQADEDSGLLRPPTGAAGSAPAPAPAPADDDVDLGDL